jgi:DHA1 family tetracycline resistance protein-like MFS transporter
MQKEKIFILLTVFIDVMGLGIIIPILPFYVESFGASAFVVTALFSVFAICSFFSAPLIGALSDKFGRRPLLIVSILSTSLGWAVFALAPTIPILFLGRIIDGLAAGNFPIAQSYLVDIARTDKERTMNLGLIGMIFGIGFIMGPFIGGSLGSIGHTIPFWTIAILAFINALLVYLFLPETRSRQDHKKISLNPFTLVKRAIINRKLRPNYIAWVFFGLAIASMQSVFALYASEIFGYGELAIGFIFTGMGVIIALNQGVALKHFWLKHFKEPSIELWMLLIYAIGFIMLSVHSLIFFFAGIVITTFGQSILRVVMTSQIASRAEKDEKGEVLGITASLTSLSFSVGPIFAGAVFGITASLPFLLSSVFLIIAFTVLHRNKKSIEGNFMTHEPEIISEI